MQFACSFLPGSFSIVFLFYSVHNLCSFKPRMTCVLWNAKFMLNKMKNATKIAKLEIYKFNMFFFFFLNILQVNQNDIYRLRELKIFCFIGICWKVGEPRTFTRFVSIFLCRFFFFSTRTEEKKNCCLFTLFDMFHFKNKSFIWIGTYIFHAFSVRVFCLLSSPVWIYKNKKYNTIVNDVKVNAKFNRSNMRAFCQKIICVALWMEY